MRVSGTRRVPAFITLGLLAALVVAGPSPAIRAQTGRSVAKPAAAPAASAIDTRSVTIEGPRRIADPGWVSLWKAGGNDNDELFGAPRELLAGDDGVYVLDPGTRELLAFTPVGALRWRAGGRGEGPGQLKRPVDLTFAPNGDIAVLDPDNGRVSFFDRSGRFRRSASSAAAAVATSLCVNDASQLYFLTQSTSAFVEVTDSRGKRLGTIGFPFDVPHDAPPFVRSAIFARGDASRQCAFATTFGFGIGRFEPSRAARTAPFVEAVPAPRFANEKTPSGSIRTTMTQGATAAVGAIHLGDSVVVFFAGTTRRANAVADVYDGAGRYVESWTVPCPLPAYRSPWLYCLFNVQEAPRLMGFVARADTTRVLNALNRRGSRARDHPGNAPVSR